MLRYFICILVQWFYINLHKVIGCNCKYFSIKDSICKGQHPVWRLSATTYYWFTPHLKQEKRSSLKYDVRMRLLPPFLLLTTPMLLHYWPSVAVELHYQASTAQISRTGRLLGAEQRDLMFLSNSKRPLVCEKRSGCFTPWQPLTHLKGKVEKCCANL